MLEKLPSRRRAQWIESIPQDVRDELDQIKQQFFSGKIPNATKTGLATAIVASLKARGLDVGQCTVARWIEKQ